MKAKKSTRKPKKSKAISEKEPEIDAEGFDLQENVV